MSKRPPRGIVSEAIDPPDVGEGERISADIENIEKVDGMYGDQWQFSLTLENGYPTRSWVKHYAKPTVRTDLGKLLQTIQYTIDKDIFDIAEGMDWLSHYGVIYVECKGWKTKDDGSTFPTFKVCTHALPTKPRTFTPEKLDLEP